MALNDNHILKRWRGDFFAGLAIVGPSIITVAVVGFVVVWIFQNVSNVTDKMLFFLPKSWIRPKLANGSFGEIPWYWSWIALLWGLFWAIFLVCLVGRYGKNYLGRKAIEWLDLSMMRVPLMNKIYGTVKQVNQSFSSNKSSFKQVVLVTFPHGKSRAVGFVTGEQMMPDGEKLVSVFIPTTPIPTSGFLIMVPETETLKLNMSVADGIKFIISLGAISPDTAAHLGHHLTASPPDVP
jgi:uncharacterized membrane protein